MKRLLRTPVIFDGRNLYEPEIMRDHGFTYFPIGRTAVRASDATGRPSAAKPRPS
jgi:UDPglucose 6-dehydrogenase